MTSVRSASASDSRDSRQAGSAAAARAASALGDAEPSREETVLQLSGLQRRFRNTRALADVDLVVRRGETVGLVGRNGSGKTTLLRHAAGLLLPDAGTCRVFGCASDRLDDATLARIGYVPQQARFLPWMTVQRHCDYVASFHDTWDKARCARLLAELELDARALVGTLTPGDVQKLALITAVCQRPGLVLLDEPVSSLDPLAREAVLAFLVELLAQDAPALIISSHGLRDVERIVERVVCLAAGHVVVDGSLDALRERHAEWRLVSPGASLPAHFDEPFVLRQEGDARQARLCVRDAEPYRAAFEARHGVAVEVVPLNLERLFPLWADAGTPRSAEPLR